MVTVIPDMKCPVRMFLLPSGFMPFRVEGQDEGGK